MALLLSRALGQSFDVTLVAPAVSDSVRGVVEAQGGTVVDLGESYFAKAASLVFLESWLREVCFGRSNSAWQRMADRPDITLNLSNSMIAKADAWYMLGSVSRAVADVTPGLPLEMQVPARASMGFIKALDSKQIRHSGSLATIRVACSYACSRSYRSWGVLAQHVIYPPLDTEVFCPTTDAPSNDYFVTYLGKETDFRPLIGLAEAGVQIVGFGSKFEAVPRSVRNHPNIVVRGFVQENDLVGLYSNAMCTLFPFTSEPFGYVPVESMACGTPVLTYAKEGPAETVVNDQTGWLVSDGESFVRKGLAIWQSASVSRQLREACRKRSLEFAVDKVAHAWLRVLPSLP